MLLLPICILALLVHSPLASRIALDPRDDHPLKPWEISYLTTFSPSGRPGSSPWSLLNLTITDPNTILAGETPTGNAVFEPSTVNCSLQWTFGDLDNSISSSNNNSSSPYNRPTNCTETTHGFWTMEMLRAENATYQSPTEDFDLKFTLVRSLSAPGNVYAKTYVGTGRFRIGQNMGGLCSASGVCTFGLQEEENPVLVEQTRTECSGLCGCECGLR